MPEGLSYIGLYSVRRRGGRCLCEFVIDGYMSKAHDRGAFLGRDWFRRRQQTYKDGENDTFYCCRCVCGRTSTGHTAPMASGVRSVRRKMSIDQRRGQRQRRGNEKNDSASR